MSNMSNESSLSSHSIPQIKTFTSTDRGRVAAFLAGVLSSRVGVAPGSILFFLFFFFPLLLTICCLSLHYKCRDVSLTKVEASCVKRSSQCWQMIFSFKGPCSLCVLTVSHEPRRSSTTAFILVSTETEHGGDNDRGS